MPSLKSMKPVQETAATVGAGGLAGYQTPLGKKGKNSKDKTDMILRNASSKDKERIVESILTHFTERFDELETKVEDAAILANSAAQQAAAKAAVSSASGSGGGVSQSVLESLITSLVGTITADTDTENEYTSATAVGGLRVVGWDGTNLFHVEADNISHVTSAIGITRQAGNTVKVVSQGDITEPTWSYTHGDYVFVGLNGTLSVGSPPIGANFALLIGQVTAPNTISFSFGNNPIVLNP